jgi:Dyp-type peroxidase family
LDTDNVQGNILAGFNKDHQTFLFVNFADGCDAHGWLDAIVPDIATTTEVAAFNGLFSRINARRGRELGTVQATWVNVALSASGMAALGVAAADLARFDPAFQAGMANRAGEIGDVGANAPSTWLPPLGSTEIHGVVLIASDDPSDLGVAVGRQIETMAGRGIRLLREEHGRARTDLPGHEHFGFKDGISQPGVRGITAPANPADANQGVPGQDLLWPGEFVLGYPRQQPAPPAPQPIPGPPDYGGGQTLPQTSTSDLPVGPGDSEFPEPDWARDGSYLVFRRLRQNVPAFNDFVAATAATEQRPAALIGAKFVGRYKSGCPLEPPSDRTAVDTQTADPSSVDATFLTDGEINNFEYGVDADGQIVPRAAHIRKAYPRDEPTPGGGEADTQTHRLLRRGIAYGAPFDDGAPVGDPHAGDADRGLLFFCYQSSIIRQFEFVQKFWVNNPNFPENGDGQDPIIAQATAQRSFSAPGLSQPIPPIAQFVATTGGEYFFQPSLSALQSLARGPESPPAAAGQ